MTNTTKFRFVKLTLSIAAACLAVIGISSCNNVLALGGALNLVGPQVHIEYPYSRQPVDRKFFIYGTVEDPTGISLLTIKAQYDMDTNKPKSLAMQWKWTPEAGWKMSTSLGDAGPWEDVLPVDGVPDENGYPVDGVGAEWSDLGNNKYYWKIPVDLGASRVGGQYGFTVSAANKAGTSDTGSTQIKMVVVYEKNPSIQIVSPSLFTQKTNSELVRLDPILDADEPKRQNPVDIRYFLNGELDLKWTIEEVNDIWSLDIRFFDWSIPDPFDTMVWDNYIYRLNINGDETPGPGIKGSDAIRPTGSAKVPDLTETLSERKVYADELDPLAHHDYVYTHEVKNSLTAKETLQIAARVINFGTLDNEPEPPIVEDNRLAGYFIYWPDADLPWVESPAGLWGEYMEDDNHNFRELYSVFPGTDVYARAYDDDGVKEVEYWIYRNSGNGILVLPLDDEVDHGKDSDANEAKIYSWMFNTPLAQGEYAIRAIVRDINYVSDTATPKSFDEFWGYLKVMDLSSPEIKAPYKPVASEPGFMHINTKNSGGAESLNIADWTVDFEGIASVFTEMESVSMVWINPNSVNYAAMSQLSFFRDQDYPGWNSKTSGNVLPVAGLTTAPGLDKTYDNDHPNKVWLMELGPSYINEKGRKEYVYKKKLNLVDDFNIKPGAEGFNYLKSQIFVLKATDNSVPAKSTIIAWAPLGDAKSPTVEINKVQILRSGNLSVLADDDLTPGSYIKPIIQFDTGDQIIVTGTWEEDSTEYFDIEAVLKNQLVVTVNGRELDGTNISNPYYTIKEIFPAKPASGKWLAPGGTWTAKGTVRRWGDSTDNGSYRLVAENLKDTLVVSAKLTDVGGNISESGGSWLIESDALKFLRVGSTTPDGTYKVGAITSTPGLPPGYIDIFLEFNKPVMLSPGIVPADVVLELNVQEEGGLTKRTAAYNENHPDHLDGITPRPSTRQHFMYEIEAGDETPANAFLNVSKLVTALAFNAPGYPFAWVAPNEEIRMTNSDESGTGFFTAKLPVTTTTTDSDYLYTLVAGKHITIDTTPPKLDPDLLPEKQIIVSGKGGMYNGNFTIYLTMSFDEPVYAGASEPNLVLNIKKNNPTPPYTTVYYDKATDRVQVSNKKVTFVYNIQDGDYTPGADDGPGSPKYGGDLQIKGLEGDITDLAGNKYIAGTDLPIIPVDSSTPPNAIQVKAIKPPTPTVKLLKSTDPADYVINNSQTGNSGGVGLTWNPVLYADTETFINNFSPANMVKLGSLYSDELYFLIEPEGEEGVDYERIEWSTNYGRDWGTLWRFSDGQDYVADPPIERKAQGYCAITVRQVDGAGNVSDWSKPIAFYWDRGDLLTRITSTSANATYTNKASGTTRIAAQIPIVFNFRRPVKLLAAPEIILNAYRTSVPTPDPTDPFNTYYPAYKNVDFDGNSLGKDCVHIIQTYWYDSTQDKNLGSLITFPMSTAVSSFTFLYTVGRTDSTFNSGSSDYDYLDVLDIKFNAEDEYKSDVNNLINLDKVKIDHTNLGDTSKRIKVMTGIPNRVGSPVFSGAINSDDTYNATLTITFDKEIYKNTSTLQDSGGNWTVDNVITAIQAKAGYRIPAVLTEAQYNLYKGLVNKELARMVSSVPVYTTVKRFDDFYEPGTNGYSNGKADTSMKYILIFDYDTHDIAPNEAGAAEEQFAEAFRQSEKTEISISSSNVDVTGKVLTVSFTGSSALKVLGAPYEISYLAGFVQDELGNTCLQLVNHPVSTTGVSKPFVRLKKTQDEIFESNDPALSAYGVTPLAAGPNWPRLVAIQPAHAQLRMDSRTPGSDVKYLKAETRTTEDLSASNTAGDYWTYDKGWTLPGTLPVYGVSSTQNPNNGSNLIAADPALTNNPGTAALAASNIATTTNAAIFEHIATSDGVDSYRTMEIGDDANANGVYQGYRLKIRAVGRTETSPGVYAYSNDSNANNVTEDMIYRSVLTFKGNNVTGTGGQTFDDGDQLWVRGGNTMFGSTIPGFPLTSGDNFLSLKAKERAGIRLMSKIRDTTASVALTSSVWQWVTWEINTAAYINLYLGHDAGVGASNAAQAYKYGPLQSAAQKGNWSLLKEYYCLFPGDNRWLHNVYPDIDSLPGNSMMGDFTFNGSFEYRPINSILPSP